MRKPDKIADGKPLKFYRNQIHILSHGGAAGYEIVASN